MSDSITTTTAPAGSPAASRTTMLPAAWLLLFVPALVVAVKHYVPQAVWLRETLTLETLAPLQQHDAMHILFLPLAAIFVVFFRLTLGLRVLGPFRAILLAWAFHYTGVWVGSLLLVVTVTTLIVLRKRVSKLRLPFFGRISVMLSAVAVLMVAFLLVATWTHADWLLGITKLPVVVLCLLSEAFVEVLRKEGYQSAVWRMCTTTVLGMAITIFAMWPLPGHLMIANPELVLFQIGLIVVISRKCKWKLLEHWNPGPGGEDDDAPHPKPAAKLPVSGTGVSPVTV